MTAKAVNRAPGRRTLAAALAVGLVAGCGPGETGPIAVSAIGERPRMVNPNLRPLDPPSAFLLEAVAQGLVRFDANGEIEPGLAQSWIVSDDGLRYTFRIRRTEWAGGERVTAEQVAARLRAAASRASRNRLKPVLGAIDDVVAMTDEVLEISLNGPRPNLLQLLAQPEMAILLDLRGTGPFRVESNGHVISLVPPGPDEDEDEAPRSDMQRLWLRGEAAAMAIARFVEGGADLVIGGTIGELPLARAADIPGNRLILDPVNGLFGLAVVARDGPLADPVVRRALSMAIDRDGLIEALGGAGLQPRVTLVPPGMDALPRPTVPDWAQNPLPMRRDAAARAIAALGGERARVRVAMPDRPGYRILFARLRRDWRLIGVEAERVAPGAAADLSLVDEVAPAIQASWYLRHFTCDASPVCDSEADASLQAARMARTLRDRQLELQRADQILTARTPFIPLATPVRWSLVSRRPTGFRPNAFARHSAETLMMAEN